MSISLIWTKLLFLVLPNHSGTTNNQQHGIFQSPLIQYQTPVPNARSGAYLHSSPHGVQYEMQANQRPNGGCSSPKESSTIQTIVIDRIGPSGAVQGLNIMRIFRM